MNELTNRGVDDILIAVVDLKGFPDATNQSTDMLTYDLEAIGL